MPPTLPYAFDTTKSGQLILKGTAVIQALLALELPYILIYEPLKLIPFVLVSAVLVSLGVFVFKAIGGVSGTMTDREITVHPSVLWGVRANGPEGSFPLAKFKCIRIDVIPTGKRGPHDRLTLIGHESTPDIQFARTRKAEGLALGHALGALLSLPVEEKLAPY